MPPGLVHRTNLLGPEYGLYFPLLDASGPATRCFMLSTAQAPHSRLTPYRFRVAVANVHREERAHRQRVRRRRSDRACSSSFTQT